MGPGQFRVLHLYLALSDWRPRVQCLPTRIRCEYSLQQPGPQGAIFFNSKPGGPIVNVLHYWPQDVSLLPMQMHIKVAMSWQPALVSLTVTLCTAGLHAQAPSCRKRCSWMRALTASPGA